MRRSAFQFTIAIPKMWFGHPPNSLNPWGSTSRPERRLAQRRADTSQRFDRCSRFDRRPCLTGAPFRPALIPTWRPCFARHLYSPGGHISTGAHVHLAPIPIRHPCFVRRPCSPDGHVSPNAHAHLVLMFRPTLKGDLGGAYRTRTSGTNPPWQESYSMHDFEAPDVK